MQEIVDYMERQLVLTDDIEAKLADVKAALQTSISGQEVRAAVGNLEPYLAELAQFDAWQQDILAAWDETNMADLLRAQPASPEHDEAMRLFYALEERQIKLKNEVATVDELLSRCKKFIDYTVNVMAAAKVDGTYGPPGATQSGVSGRRMYEANI